MNLLQKIASKVGGVYNFDPSQVDVLVAGYALSDFTAITLTPSVKRRSEQGVDATYHTYVDLPTYATLTVTTLPVGVDVLFFEALQDELDVRKGWFEVQIKSNGRFIGTYACYFTADSADTLTESADDKVYEMVAVRQDDALFMQDSSQTLF